MVDSRFPVDWLARPGSSAGQVIQMLDVSRSQAGAAEELKAPRRALAKPGAGSVSRAGTGVGTVGGVRSARTLIPALVILAASPPLAAST